MNRTPTEWAQLVAENHGFANPNLWAPLAQQLGFHRVAATARPRCPDCGGAPAGYIGQYVYYSTLHCLAECGQCGLIWADAEVDPAVLSQHFEDAYKDTSYFTTQRAPIFAHLARLIDEATPQAGSVLDVGAATGYLMQHVHARRPDIARTVTDISETACETARAELNLPALCGDIPTLGDLGQAYDTVVLSDVLYYESRLRDAWRAITKLVKPGGTLIYRGPNQLGRIRASQKIWASTHNAEQRALQLTLRGYNTEHKYILSRDYLTRRLLATGFTNVRVETSPMLLSSRFRRVLPYADRAVAALHTWTQGRVTLSPSLVVIATRLPGGPSVGSR